MIREASEADLPFIVSVGANFHAVSGHTAPFVEQDFEKTIRALIKSDVGAVFRNSTGVLVGMIYPVFYNRAWMQAQELLWWGGGSSRSLLEAFEHWAMERHVNEIVMGSLQAQKPKVVARLLRRRGYSEKENLYSKVI